MGGNGFTNDWAGSGHEVEHTSWDANFVHNLGQDEGINWRHFRWLQNNGASSCKCRGNLVGDLVQWVVPRCDATNDANWLADEQGIALFALPLKTAGTVGHIAKGASWQTGLDEA